MDKKIVEWNEEIPVDVRDPYAPGMIARTINGYNVAATSKDLQRVLKHSVVTRNPQTELEARKLISSISGDVTTIEVERMVKNINYVENV